MSTGYNRSRLSDMMVAQTIRLIEENGPLEDSQAMSHAFRSKSGREDRLLERASVLGQRLKLDAEIARWRDVAPYICLALSLFVGFIAYGIAAAVIGGDRSLNAVLAFFVALGVHAVTLAAWCVAVVVSAWSSRGSSGRLSFGSLLLRLVAWLPLDRGPHSLTMLNATTSLLHRARLIPWAFGFISHAIWALAFVLVLMALWFAFSFQAYRLTWETTILSGDFFVRFVHATGWLPHVLGFPLPDISTILAAGDTGSDQRAWAWWLIGCVFVYGLLPRIGLAGLSWIFWRRGQASLKLDTSDPYFRKLLARFDEMEASTVVDAEHRPDATAGTAPHLLSSGDPDSSAVIGFELPAEYPWPPGKLNRPDSLIERIAGASQERRALLDKLAAARPRKMLVVCNAASSPDRGTERFIREASTYATQCGLLLASPSRDDVNTQRWQSWLQHIGMGQIQTFTDMEAATAWLEPAHA